MPGIRVELVEIPPGCHHGPMTDREQNAPIEHGSLDSSEEAKKQGILIQVAADMPNASAGEIEQMLAQRFADAGIAVEPAELRSLAGSLPSVDTQSQAENADQRIADGA
jgi:hypothetical protein